MGISIPEPEPDLSLTSKADKILWAAKYVFLHYGYEGTSMDEIAAAADASKRTVYNHFGSKEVLFREVINFATRLFAGKIREPDFYSNDPIEALTYFFARLLQLMIWAESIAFQRLLIAEVNRFPDVSQPFCEGTIKAGNQMLQEYFSRHGHANPGGLLQAATSQRYIETLFGIRPPIQGPPGDIISTEIDLSPIRNIVRIYWENTAPQE
ncbi:MAG TPA: TetR/AcrR family transcriptional regulator [Ktedonobacteraceae bacterium]|nr:TetR/AcrR family transcriptional regulator [Ktedonobacteraceae bacterium]